MPPVLPLPRLLLDRRLAFARARSLVRSLPEDCRGRHGGNDRLSYTEAEKRGLLPSASEVSGHMGTTVLAPLVHYGPYWGGGAYLDPHY